MVLMSTSRRHMPQPTPRRLLDSRVTLVIGPKKFDEIPRTLPTSESEHRMDG